MALCHDPLYIAEISPEKHRGRLVGYAELALNVGALLGIATSFALSFYESAYAWRLMIGVGALLIIIMFALLFIMPGITRYK